MPPTPYPRSTRDTADLHDAIRKYILPGFIPAAPMFSRSDAIWTIGSCFAENIATAFEKHGLRTLYAALKEVVNAPPALRFFVDLAANGDLPDLRAFIESAAGAVITLGVGAAEFGPEGQLAREIDTVTSWRPLTVAECQADIAGAIAAIRAINPGIRIILTLSPVPIARNLWTDASPLVADCISKTTLRAAIDQYLKTDPGDVYYWPAFEIVRWLGAHRSGHYGGDDGLQRHVTLEVVNAVVALFIESYFETL